MYIENFKLICVCRNIGRVLSHPERGENADFHQGLDDVRVMFSVGWCGTNHDECLD